MPTILRSLKARAAWFPALACAACAASQSLADGAWREMPPPARAEHVAVCDSLRDRMVVHGGGADGHSLWTLGLEGGGNWAALAAQGAPTGSLWAGVHDPLRDRILFYGGNAPGGTSAVWALSLSGPPVWTALATSGTAPPARRLGVLLYDPPRDRLLLLFGSDTQLRTDVWQLTLSGTPTWSLVSASGPPPPPRTRATAAYDPVRDRIVGFGGDSGGYPVNDVWALALSPAPAWVPVSPSGTAPSARQGATSLYDPYGDRFLLFGGMDQYVGTAPERNDLWALSLGGAPAWSLLAPAGGPPLGRFGHSVILDRERSRMVVFGGHFYVGCSSCGTVLGDTWALALGGSPAWSRVVPATGTTPPLLFGPGVYDPQADRLDFLLCDYDFGAQQYVNSYWSLATEPSALWTGLAPAGGPAGGRIFRAPQWDPVRERVIAFGGWSSSQQPLADLWALDPSGAPSWTSIVASGGPPPLNNSCESVYDPLRDRLLVFSGTSDGAVWALDLAGSPAWTQIAAAGSPPLAYSQGIYDPARDRLVIQGLNLTVWALPLGAPVWTQLPVSGTPQSGVPVYDPVRDRMVVAGSAISALEFGEVSAWSQLAPAGGGPTSWDAAIFDPTRDRLVLRAESRLWEFAWGQGAAPQVSGPGDVVWSPGGVNSIDYGIHNPFGAAQTFDYTITSERAWPGFPITGSRTVAARSTGTIAAGLPVPDSVAAGLNTITFAATLQGMPRASARRSHHLHDAATPALVSLVEANAEAGRVRLRWQVGPDLEPPFVVERREGRGGWSDAAIVSRDGEGRITFVDEAVRSGVRYGYRLAWETRAGRGRSGEVEIEVPAAARLALEELFPNPAATGLWARFSLPDAGAATLEVFDLMGRRRFSREVGALGPGSHILPVAGAERYAPGVYMVRLVGSAGSFAKRAVIAR